MCKTAGHGESGTTLEVFGHNDSIARSFEQDVEDLFALLLIGGLVLDGVVGKWFETGQSSAGAGVRLRFVQGHEIPVLRSGVHGNE